MNASIPGRNFSICCASLFREDYLFENFLTVLNALFWVFVRRVAVYLLRSVESSGLLYAAGGNSSKLFHLLSPYSDFRTSIKNDTITEHKPYDVIVDAGSSWHKQTFCVIFFT